MHAEGDADRKIEIKRGAVFVGCALQVSAVHGETACVCFTTDTLQKELVAVCSELHTREKRDEPGD